MCPLIIVNLYTVWSFGYFVILSFHTYISWHQFDSVVFSLFDHFLVLSFSCFFPLLSLDILVSLSLHHFDNVVFLLCDQNCFDLSFHLFIISSFYHSTVSSFPRFIILRFVASFWSFHRFIESSFHRFASPCFPMLSFGRLFVCSWAVRPTNGLRIEPTHIMQ